MSRSESAVGELGIARLVTAQVCLHGCLTGLRMAAPLWALRTLDNALLAGVLVAMFAVSQVFLALPAGRFVERQGMRRSIGAGVLVAALGGLLAALWPALWSLALAALLSGAGSGMTIIALQRHVGLAARDPAHRRSLFSWLAIGPSLSNFLGPLLAGAVIDLAGFRAAFAALAILPLLGWWVAHQAMPGATASDETAPAGESAWTLLREPAFVRLLLVNWLLSTCWDVHSFMVPLLGHAHDFSASAIGAILGTFALAATAVRFAMPLAAQHLRERQVIIYAQLGTGAVFIIYPLLDSALAMGVCSALLGITLGSVQPMVMSTLHHIVPATRVAKAIALRLMVVYGSSVAMPILFGAAGATVGATAVFWVTGGAVGAGAWVARKLGEAGH
jgi:MFS family permease